MTFQVSMKSQYLAKNILCHILTFSGTSHRALIKHRIQISSLGDDAAHCLSFHNASMETNHQRNTDRPGQLCSYEAELPNHHRSSQLPISSCR